MTDTNREKAILILPVPNRVLSPNFHAASISGRYMKASATKKYRKITKENAECAKIETLPWQKVRVKPIFYYKYKRLRDEDNAEGSLKAMYDGLVDAGIVANDDYKHMTKERPVFRLDRRNPRVEITLTRLK